MDSVLADDVMVTSRDTAVLVALNSDVVNSRPPDLVDDCPLIIFSSNR